MNLGRFGRVIVPVGLWLSLSSPASAALVTLTGKVTDQNGGGIFNVTINFVDSCTGVVAGAINNVNIDVADAITPVDLDLSHDRTGATGTYSVAVPPGP